MQMIWRDFTNGYQIYILYLCIIWNSTLNNAISIKILRGKYIILTYFTYGINNNKVENTTRIIIIAKFVRVLKHIFLRLRATFHLA